MYRHASVERRHEGDRDHSDCLHWSRGPGQLWARRKPRDQIVQFAAREKLPVVYGRREYVDAGGLLSYSANIQFAYVRSADYVHRILRGAKPADLPVEQSSNMQMVLNLKTARALGIKIPDSVRLRADEVIE